MYTTPLNTNTGSYWVDTIIVALNSNLGTVARDTGYTLDGNQTILNLRNLSLKQALQELWTCTAQDNAWVVVLVLYLLNDGTYGLTLVLVV